MPPPSGKGPLTCRSAHVACLSCSGNEKVFALPALLAAHSSALGADVRRPSWSAFQWPRARAGDYGGARIGSLRRPLYRWLVNSSSLALDAESAAGARWRIAIADDNDGVRVLLRALLELESDFVVAGEAADGQAALRLVENESPDLLILDLAMPVIDGLQVLERLRDVDGATRVLVYSGFASSEAEQAARALGARDYVVKGIDPALLIERVRELCR